MFAPEEADIFKHYLFTFIINEFVLIKYLVFSIIVIKGPLPPCREGRGATF
jgi:hypothetical protein